MPVRAARMGRLFFILYYVTCIGFIRCVCHVYLYIAINNKINWEGTLMVFIISLVSWHCLVNIFQLYFWHHTHSTYTHTLVHTFVSSVDKDFEHVISTSLVQKSCSWRDSIIVVIIVVDTLSLHWLPKTMKINFPFFWSATVMCRTLIRWCSSMRISDQEIKALKMIYQENNEVQASAVSAIFANQFLRQNVLEIFRLLRSVLPTCDGRIDIDNTVCAMCDHSHCILNHIRSGWMI